MTVDELRERGERLLPARAVLSPSPLERREIRAEGPPLELWVKRDDRLGEGGTKVRKLAAELARAQVRGARVLTFGLLDSNHAVATARAAERLGIPAELWIQGEASLAPELAARLMASAPTSFRRSAAGLALGVAGQWIAARIRGQPLQILPPGGTTAASTAAVALAVGEVVAQLAALGATPPERWAVAVGSGGTLAGLWAGVRALGLEVRPYGVAASSRWVGPRAVAWLANRALAFLGVDAQVEPGEVEIDTALLGRGHGQPPPEVAAARSAFEAAGLELDPIFTARAAAGLRARAQPGERWLLWHTGTAVR